MANTDNQQNSDNLDHQRQGLIKALQKFLPTQAILHQQEELYPYECDGLSAYRCLPLLVALPETVPQVQAIVRYCCAHKIPVVARGAGTGLSGGALPIANGLLLSLAKFSKIIEIDAQNRLAKVQPGVRNIAISEAVAHLGLYYAPDPSSQIACTIGGNVAENSGGVHCLKYGLTVHNIQQLKIITMEGELLEIGSTGMEAAGYDLLALLTGSEGLLGIIVEVTVKLLVKPAHTQVILASFNDIGCAGNAVSAIIAAGIIPAGLELMDKLAIQAAENFVHAGYPLDAEAILLCEIDGLESEVTAHTQKACKLLQDEGAIKLRIAQDESERIKLWKGRKAAFPAMGQISPDYYCMDGTIPRKQLAHVLSRIAELSAQYELPVANVFHAGDGNLHPLILYDANRSGELAKTEAFGGKILELCVEVGGTITGEHGVGIEKINQMCVQFNPAELRQLHQVKEAFDANGLLNPGKAVPTLQRCAEFGAMHVHNNQIPFPDLDRF